MQGQFGQQAGHAVLAWSGGRVAGGFQAGC
jgi:hypothetical protein